MQPQSAIVPVARGNIEPPYCWQSKTALRKIRETFDGDTFLDQAFAVYLIHCELASDKASPIYEARRRTIAERSGVSLRRVSEIHERLKQIGLLDWRQNKIEGTSELGASTFMLLSCSVSTTQCTPSTTPCTENTRLCKNENSAFAQNIEESNETIFLKKYDEVERELRGRDKVSNEQCPEFIAAWEAFANWIPEYAQHYPIALQFLKEQPRKYLRPLERISLPAAVALLRMLIQKKTTHSIDAECRRLRLFSSHPR